MIARDTATNGTSHGARDRIDATDDRDRTEVHARHRLDQRSPANDDDDDVDDVDRNDLLDAVAATDIRLYDATDLPWITIVIDHVMSCLGQPWRILRERLDHAPIRGARIAAILAAMRRLMDGGAQRAKIARKVRAAVLGHPALDDDARTARLAKAGDELGIDPSEIESLLWIDLADERPVTLPNGRPDESRLAAYANVDRIQRALRRARHVRVHAWGDPHTLIRAAARYGLLARVSTTAETDDAETIIDIVGPLSLFHQTQVYGRAIGAIVPLLSGLPRFVVEIDADFGYGAAALRVASPALLPPPPTERGKPSLATTIASALGRVPNVLVEIDPPPIAHGRDRLFPDLAIELPGPTRSRDSLADDLPLEEDHDLFPDLVALLAEQMNDSAARFERPMSRPSLHPSSHPSSPPAVQHDRSKCWFVEVVGFATTEYLTAKLARYDAAGIERVVLVVDDTRDASLAEVRRVVRYDKRTIVADLLSIIEETT